MYKLNARSVYQLTMMVLPRPVETRGKTMNAPCLDSHISLKATLPGETMVRALHAFAHYSEEYLAEKKATIIDLRSDTMTKPSLAMKQAMFDAKVGDDTYGEDPTSIELQKYTADLLGKEASLFIPSGSMANLIAIMNHCDIRGSEAYCGQNSHTILHEQGAPAAIAGVMLSGVLNNEDGTYDLQVVEGRLRKDIQHEPISKLMLIENTFNGKILPQSWIEEVGIFSKKHNLKLHMDGARVFNAAAGSNVSVKDIVRPCDSVTFCLSKALGAPVGSVLCGSKSFIERSRRIRKALGGSMRQVGVLAAAGLVALKETPPLLKLDHKRAFSIAQAINDSGSKEFTVNLKDTVTNSVFVNVNSKSITAKDFIDRLEAIIDDVEDERTIVRGMAFNPRLARFVLYRDIDDAGVEKAIRKITRVIKKLDDGLKC